MQHDVPLLLGPRDEIGQPLPGHEVVRAGDPRLRHGGGEIVRRARVLPLGAEHAVDPAVLVRRQAHVVDVEVAVAVCGMRIG
jgi:hypothetical protein